MYSVLLIALGVPAVVLSAGFACRRGPARLAADIRGIALQTVIIIVVMLLIAGGVSAVLLSRGQEAISDLELASVGGINAANCQQATHSIRGATSTKGMLVTVSSQQRCRFIFTGTDLATGSQTAVTDAECKRLDRNAEIGANALHCEIDV